MNELSIRLSVLNSKTFATKVIADIVSNGSKVKTYEQRLFNQISQPNIKRMAEDIKKLIDTNLKQGLKYTGGKVAPLSEATIEAKKRKGRRQPDRVFLDSGILFQSLRLVPIAKGFAVTFKKIKYPKSKLSVMEVAQFLVDGTPKMPARPFFGITELQLNKIISRHASARRITVEPTPRQVEQAGRAIKLITGFDPLKVQVIKSEGLKGTTVQMRVKAPKTKGLQSVTVSSEKLAVQEVVTTAPKVAEFVPAKTVKEAEERAIKAGIEGDVSFGNLPIDFVNGALSAIEEEAKYGTLKNISRINVANQPRSTAAAYYDVIDKSITINIAHADKYLKFSSAPTYQDKYDQIKKFLAESEIKTAGQELTPEFKKFKKQLEKQLSEYGEKIKSGATIDAWCVSDFKNNAQDKVSVLLTHEMAHHRGRELKHLSRGKGLPLEFEYKKKMSVSQYGATNSDEYYAEWYTYYRHFGEKDVPEDLLKLFKE